MSGFGARRATSYDVKKPAPRPSVAAAVQAAQAAAAQPPPQGIIATTRAVTESATNPDKWVAAQVAGGYTLGRAAQRASASGALNRAAAGIGLAGFRDSGLPPARPWSEIGSGGLGGLGAVLGDSTAAERLAALKAQAGGAVAVTPGEADFLARMRGEFDRMLRQAQGIGSPGYAASWGFGLATYNEKFTPILDNLQAMLEESRRALPDESAARSMFTESANQANKSIMALRLKDPTDALYEAVLQALAGNPVALGRWFVQQAQNIGEAGGEVADTALGMCSPLAAIMSPVQWWNNCVGWKGKLAAAVVVGGVGYLAYRKGRKLLALVAP